jgi:hypothetical protein
MKDDLNMVYKYFSHHIRNSTSMIAASVTLLSYNMQPDDNNLAGEIVEASFLLDLFDAGMDICFRHVFGEPYKNTMDSYSIEANVIHFAEQCKAALKERSIELNVSVSNPAVIETNAHELRTLSSIVIYEMMIQAENSISMKLNGNNLEISADSFYEAPPIWKVIKQVLEVRKVIFSYADKTSTLRFL